MKPDIDALKTTLQSLRAHLASPSATSLQTRPGASNEAERREYLERVAGRAVERVMPGANLESGEGLAGKPMPGPKAGRSVDVAAMEGVRDLLQAGGGGDGDDDTRMED